MRPTALLAAVLLGVPAIAADGPEVTPVPAPAPDKWVELRVPAGELVVLQAVPASKWRVEIGKPPHVFEAGRFAVFAPMERGETRRVRVSGPDGSERLLSVVAGDGPAPPDPPDPPKPDQLTADLRAAFAADKGTAADMQALAALYRLMADEAVKADYATVGDLNAVYLKARDSMLKAGLATVRRRVGQEIAAVFPDAAAPLTDALRKRAVAVYLMLWAAVGEAGK